MNTTLEQLIEEITFRRRKELRNLGATESNDPDDPSSRYSRPPPTQLTISEFCGYSAHGSYTYQKAVCQVFLKLLKNSSRTGIWSIYVVISRVVLLSLTTMDDIVRS